MTSELSRKRCVPCEGGVAPVKGAELGDLAKQIGIWWTIKNEHHLEGEFTFDDFAQALEFTNQVGGLAEEEGHHPDILLSYGRVEIKLWTHAINGLSENDFILAAKIDELR
jgi:4a-hydroxytetrahydrobiopterin dehydratase